MKKQLSITALTCSALLALTNQVSAEDYKVGDVFYCESEAGAFVESSSSYELKKSSQEKFKFKIENKSLVKFDTADWLVDPEYVLEFYLKRPDLLMAKNEYSSFFMAFGRFNFTMSHFGFARLMTGTCDKF